MKDRVLLELLDGFPGKRILVVGDVMLDEYLWGDVRRISPEAPVPVVAIQRQTYMGGGAANTAANIVSLGAEALLGGVVGRDPYAGKLREVLGQTGAIPAGLIEDAGRPTTTKTRIVAHSQQVVRVDREQAVPLPTHVEEALLGWVEEQIPSADACILSDYAKGVVSPRLAECLIRMARQARKPIVVDPKGTDYAKYRGATVVKPNVHEVERSLRQEIHNDPGLRKAGQVLLDLLGGAALLITRGPQGMSLFRDGEEPVDIPTFARNVYDVTGAGDTVVSTLALSLSAGATLEEAAHLANRAAGIVVGKVGTSTVTPAELRRQIKRISPAEDARRRTGRPPRLDAAVTKH
jgi:D-beta-D-heptose 7-phosphate kinase/D-beta-D-heptose 1-phosphate adenosyltransferase